MRANGPGRREHLLCSEDVAFALTDNPVRLYIAGGSHTLRTGDRRPMRIPLLPHETEEGYAWLYKEMEQHDGRWPGFESFGATRSPPTWRIAWPASRILSRISTSSRRTTRSRSRICRLTAT